MPREKIEPGPASSVLASREDEAARCAAAYEFFHGRRLIKEQHGFKRLFMRASIDPPFRAFALLDSLPSAAIRNGAHRSLW